MRPRRGQRQPPLVVGQPPLGLAQPAAGQPRQRAGLLLDPQPGGGEPRRRQLGQRLEAPQLAPGAQQHRGRGAGQPALARRRTRAFAFEHPAGQELGHHGRGLERAVADQVGDGAVDLVAEAAQDRQRAAGHRARHQPAVEGGQVAARAAAAHHHQRVERLAGRAAPPPAARARWRSRIRRGRPASRRAPGSPGRPGRWPARPVRKSW